jgi:hypothetical protein
MVVLAVRAAQLGLARRILLVIIASGLRVRSAEELSGNVGGKVAGFTVIWPVFSPALMEL